MENKFSFTEFYFQGFQMWFIEGVLKHLSLYDIQNCLLAFPFWDYCFRQGICVGKFLEKDKEGTLHYKKSNDPLTFSWALLLTKMRLIFGFDDLRLNAVQDKFTKLLRQAEGRFYAKWRYCKGKFEYDHIIRGIGKIISSPIFSWDQTTKDHCIKLFHGVPVPPLPKNVTNNFTRNILPSFFPVKPIFHIVKPKLLDSCPKTTGKIYGYIYINTLTESGLTVIFYHKRDRKRTTLYDLGEVF